MSDSTRGLVGGLIGAFLGSIGVLPGPMIGWFIGSTIGSLTGLGGDIRKEVISERQSDFKSMNSKYGIPIPRGYGTARTGGNIVWAGPVSEEEIVDIECSEPSFYEWLFGTPQTCTVYISYKYYQSGAIAFAAGPGCGILKLWADGQVVYDATPGSVEQLATVQYRNTLMPCDPEDRGPFTTYPGNATQKIDPIVKKYLGPEYTESGLDEAYAFRHIIYAVYNEIDIQAYGYKLPVLSALINFELCGKVTFTNLDESKGQIITNGSTGLITWPRVGKVHGRRNLVAFHEGNVRAIYNLRTRRAILEVPDNRILNKPIGSVTGSRFSLGTDFQGPDGGFTSNDFFDVSMANWLTGNQLSTLISSRRPAGRLGDSIWDPSRQTLFSLSHTELLSILPIPPTGITNDLLDAEEGSFNDIVDSLNQAYASQQPEAIEYLLTALSTLHTRLLIQAKTFTYFFRVVGSDNTGFSGTVNYATKIHHAFFDQDCDLWVVTMDTNGTDKQLTFCFEGLKPSLKRIEFIFNETLLATLRSVSYCPELDNLYVSVSASTAAKAAGFSSGTYKIARTEMRAFYYAEGTEGPVGTTTHPFTLPAQDGPPVFSTEDIGGDHYSITGTYAIMTGSATQIRWFDLETMEYENTLGRDGTKVGDMVGLNGGSLTYTNPIARAVHFAHLDATLINSYTLVWWRSPPSKVLLSDIVKRIMTTETGEPRAYLTAADLNVSELTDLVDGFILGSATTARDAIAQLQQTYFFDAVETNGKIFFPKRGRAEVFTIQEKDLSAHDFGASSPGSPVAYSREMTAELPREIAINYAEIDLDYLQGTQRARRSDYWESETNETYGFSIAMNKDKAAQVAEVLLREAWMTRTSPIVFRAGPKYMHLNPADVGRVVMSDGNEYRLRIVQMAIGVNGITEVIASREDYPALYTSNATGVESKEEPAFIYDNDSEILLLDMTSRLVDPGIAGMNQHGLLMGLSTYNGYGTQCEGGIINVTRTYNTAGEIDLSNRVSTAIPRSLCGAWGRTTSPFGHPTHHLYYEELDTETVLVVEFFGGTYAPESVTYAELLDGKTNLLIVGNEVIAFQDVQINFTSDVFISDLEGVRGGGPSGEDVFRTTLHDFVALGIEPGPLHAWTPAPSSLSMHGEARSVWSVGAVSSNELSLSYWGSPVYNGGGRRGRDFAPIGAYLSGGMAGTMTFTNLLRGLYGTEGHTLHFNNDHVYPVDNLKFGPIPPTRLGDPLIASLSSLVKGNQSLANKKTISYQAGNLRPWAPVEVSASGDVISFYRRDKWHSDPVNPQKPLAVSEFSESAEGFFVVVIDGASPAQEPRIIGHGIYTETVPNSNRVEVTVAGFSEGLRKPYVYPSGVLDYTGSDFVVYTATNNYAVVEIYQIGTSDVGHDRVLTGDRWRGVLSPAGVYHGHAVFGRPSSISELATNSDAAPMWSYGASLPSGKFTHSPPGFIGKFGGWVGYLGKYRYCRYFIGGSCGIPGKNFPVTFSPKPKDILGFPALAINDDYRGPRPEGSKGTGIALMEVGPAIDIEILAIFCTPPFAGNWFGCYLRGRDTRVKGKTIAGDGQAGAIFVRFGRLNEGLNYKLQVEDRRYFLKPGPTYNVEYNWRNYADTPQPDIWYGNDYYFQFFHAMRIRLFKNRIQVRAWEEPGPSPTIGIEPTGWMIDEYLDDHQNLNQYGSCGITTTAREAICSYFTYAHGGRVAPNGPVDDETHNLTFTQPGGHPVEPPY